MGKIMEAVFCVIYIITAVIVGAGTVKNSRGKKEHLLFGIMTLVLVFGDSFHLVPRIIAALDPSGDHSFSLGIGKLITSVTMTFFYLMMYYVYSIRYSYKNRMLEITMAVLTVLRVGLCLMPQNDWTGEDPVIWGIYRNIPFTVIGIIMIVLWFNGRSDKTYKNMWLAVLLSFAFYLPVVLWADVSPMIGMLMMPKSCMYIWAAVMGNRAAAKNEE